MENRDLVINDPKVSDSEEKEVLVPPMPWQYLSAGSMNLNHFQNVERGFLANKIRIPTVLEENPPYLPTWAVDEFISDQIPGYPNVGKALACHEQVLEDTSSLDNIKAEIHKLRVHEEMSEYDEEDNEFILESFHYTELEFLDDILMQKESAPKWFDVTPVEIADLDDLEIIFEADLAEKIVDPPKILEEDLHFNTKSERILRDWKDYRQLLPEICKLMPIIPSLDSLLKQDVLMEWDESLPKPEPECLDPETESEIFNLPKPNLFGFLFERNSNEDFFRDLIHECIDISVTVALTKNPELLQEEEVIDENDTKAYNEVITDDYFNDSDEISDIFDDDDSSDDKDSTIDGIVDAYLDILEEEALKKTGENDPNIQINETLEQIRDVIIHAEPDSQPLFQQSEYLESGGQFKDDEVQAEQQVYLSGQCQDKILDENDEIQADLELNLDQNGDQIKDDEVQAEQQVYLSEQCQDQILDKNDEVQPDSEPNLDQSCTYTGAQAGNPVLEQDHDNNKTVDKNMYPDQICAENAIVIKEEIIEEVNLDQTCKDTGAQAGYPVLEQDHVNTKTVDKNKDPDQVFAENAIVIKKEVIEDNVENSVIEDGPFFNDADDDFFANIEINNEDIQIIEDADSRSKYFKKSQYFTKKTIKKVLAHDHSNGTCHRQEHFAYSPAAILEELYYHPMTTIKTQISEFNPRPAKNTEIEAENIEIAIQDIKIEAQEDYFRAQITHIEAPIEARQNNPQIIALKKRAQMKRDQIEAANKCRSEAQKKKVEEQHLHDFGVWISTEAQIEVQKSQIAAPEIPQFKITQSEAAQKPQLKDGPTKAEIKKNVEKLQKNLPPKNNGDQSKKKMTAKRKAFKMNNKRSGDNISFGGSEAKKPREQTKQGQTSFTNGLNDQFAQKCAVCLWPIYSSRCYHSTTEQQDSSRRLQ